MTDKKVFFDTNLLVYANDTSNPEKQKTARKLVHEAITRGNAAISTQVLGEFWVTVTKKLAKPLDLQSTRKQITLFSAFTILPVTHETVLLAIKIQETYSLSFWDAQIIACASLERIDTVLSEDMQNGALYNEVKLINPFLSQYQE